jgi:hypothetical protein
MVELKDLLGQWELLKPPSSPEEFEKEMAEFREWQVEWMMRDFDFTEEEAMQFANIAVAARREVARDNGEI